jgi:hypothetical protein
MEHLKFDLGTLKKGSTVVVTLKSQANVLLMDASNYSNYSTYASARSARYRYFGGRATRSPFRIGVPANGHWFVALDLGGYSGRIDASVAVERPPRGWLPQVANEEVESIDQIARSAVPEMPPSTDILGGRTWDMFVSHASEEKMSVARPLAEALEREGVSVWLDELVLKVGDSLRRKIDQGIRSSRFGLVIMSHAFFAKGWTQYELDGLVTRSVTGEQNLLPIWHGVTKDDVIRQSASLADKVALTTANKTIDEIASAIADVVRDQDVA